MAAKNRNTIRFDMSFSGQNTTYENRYLFDKGGFFTPGMTTRTDTITGWTGNSMSHDLAKYMIKMTKLIDKISTLTKEQKCINDTKEIKFLHRTFHTLKLNKDKRTKVKKV